MAERALFPTKAGANHKGYLIYFLLGRGFLLPVLLSFIWLYCRQVRSDHMHAWRRLGGGFCDQSRGLLNVYAECVRAL